MTTQSNQTQFTQNVNLLPLNSENKIIKLQQKIPRARYNKDELKKKQLILDKLTMNIKVCSELLTTSSRNDRQRRLAQSLENIKIQSDRLLKLNNLDPRKQRQISQQQSKNKISQPTQLSNLVQENINRMKLKKIFKFYCSKQNCKISNTFESIQQQFNSMDINKFCVFYKDYTANNTTTKQNKLKAIKQFKKRTSSKKGMEFETFYDFIKSIPNFDWKKLEQYHNQRYTVQSRMKKLQKQRVSLTIHSGYLPDSLIDQIKFRKLNKERHKTVQDQTIFKQKKRSIQKPKQNHSKKLNEKIKTEMEEDQNIYSIAKLKNLKIEIGKIGNIQNFESEITEEDDKIWLNDYAIKSISKIRDNKQVISDIRKRIYQISKVQTQRSKYLKSKS